MSRLYKDILKVSLATINSRILGLLRDSMSMALIGINAVSSAYTFAFTLPNLFRRLLGEGALTSALIPIFSQSVESDGKTSAFEFLNRVLSRAFLLLCFLCVLGVGVSLLCTIFAESGERYFLSCFYSAILMPYMILICLAAIFSGALNVLGSFAVPSIGPSLLNLSIIVSLLIGYFFNKDIEFIAFSACLGWLFGGLLQLMLPALYLAKLGWRPKFDLGQCPYLTNLYALFLPALLGAAVMQINIFVSKILALFLNDVALPSLYVSSRLLELPLGVFTIAIATVYFPKLSSLISSKNSEAYKESFSQGLLITLCICIPAMIGIIAMGKDIISLLFNWGNFGSTDVELCLPILFVSMLGLPFFSIITFYTKAFHSLKDTKTPLNISYWAISSNIVLSVLFMFKLGAMGLALANVVSAVLQAFLLSKKLHLKLKFPYKFNEIFKIFLASLLMCALIICLKDITSLFFVDKNLYLFNCLIIIPVVALFYFGLLYIFKFKELNALISMLTRRKTC